MDPLETIVSALRAGRQAVLVADIFAAHRAEKRRGATDLQGAFRCTHAQQFQIARDIGMRFANGLWFAVHDLKCDTLSRSTKRNIASKQFVKHDPLGIDNRRGTGRGHSGGLLWRHVGWCPYKPASLCMCSFLVSKVLGDTKIRNVNYVSSIYQDILGLDVPMKQRQANAHTRARQLTKQSTQLLASGLEDWTQPLGK